VEDILRVEGATMKACMTTKCSWMQGQITRWSMVIVISSSIWRQGGDQLLKSVLKSIFLWFCHFAPRRRRPARGVLGCCFALKRKCTIRSIKRQFQHNF